MLSLSKSRFRIQRYLRSFSQIHSPLRISDEVQSAIQSKAPVVALESTIITHGLPYPRNIEMAQKVEQIIRENGAIPATIAFLSGKPCVGLSEEEIDQLAAAPANKVSRRDVAYTMANRLSGGTTISGTMILAEKAGIKVFATGGLGGAHKGAETTFDVSADLSELGRTKVAVVCAGPKSILDVAKTMEYLETQGCFVSTYGPDGTNIPGFFAVDSGVPSPYNFTSFRNAASIIHTGINEMGLESGYLFCIPPPQDVALDLAYINGVIAAAEKEANQLGISGKKLTPFLLSKIASITQGSSVDTNLKVVFNNAEKASKIAVELSKLENGSQVFTPNLVSPTTSIKKSMKKAKLLLSCSVAIVGSVAVDLMCKLTPEKYDLHDSNPGKSSTLIGGVGFNVFLAAHYASKDRNAVRFISQVGNDLFGDLVLSDLSKKNIDTSGIIRNPAQNTARYVLIHDKKGDLVVACADMGIAENFDSQRLSEALEKADPKVVLVDSNVSEDTILQVQKLSSSRKLVIEPTSSMKAGKLAKAIGKSPHSFIFTNHIQRLITEGPDSVGGLVLATPTVAELRRIHDSMDENELFDVDKWFPIIDAIGVNSDFRNKMDSLKSISFPQNILKEGIIQQAVKLLPYIPSIIVKLGQDGVLMINMTMDAGKLEDDPNNHIIVSKGKEFDLFHQLGVVVQWCPVPEKVTDIVNVTGAGDAFVGYLVLKMAEEGCSWLFEPGKLRENVLNGAQRAAAVCLMDEAAISEKIKYI